MVMFRPVAIDRSELFMVRRLQVDGTVEGEAMTDLSLTY